MGKDQGNVSTLKLRRTSIATGAMFVFLASVAGAVADDSRWVNGIEFSVQNGLWVQLDSAGEPWEIRPGRLLIKFSQPLTSAQAAGLLSPLGFAEVDTVADPGGYFSISYDLDDEAPTALEQALALDGVEDAYLDTKLKFFATANDTFFVNQWNLIKTRVDKAWDITAGSDSTTIVVMDKGFDVDPVISSQSHEDLVGALWTNTAEVNGVPGQDDDGNGCIDDFHGCDFASNSNDPSTDNDPRPVMAGDEHGTAVAGIACATRNNSKGIAGACGGDATSQTVMIPVRLFWTSDISRAFKYIRNIKPDVVNMSWGGYSDPGGKAAGYISEAAAQGTVFFAAMGNNGQDGAFVVFPATHPDVIGVGATDQNDVKTCSSNYGTFLDIMAPSTAGEITNPPPCVGSYIWTTDNYISQFSFNPGFSGCGY
jgi:hypothetical protein